MLSLGSGPTIRTSKPKNSEKTNSLSEQLLNDSMMGEQFNNKTVATQPEGDNKPLTGDTRVKQEPATELQGSTPPCAECVTVEAPSNSQQGDSVSYMPKDIPGEWDFLSLGGQNGEAMSDTDYHIGIFLDESLVDGITHITTTSNDTPFGDVSQIQPDADHWPLVSDCPIESEDKCDWDSGSNQPSLSTGTQAAKPIESNTSGLGKAPPKMTGKDINPAVVIIDENTEQMVKPRRQSPRNAAKRSFKDFVRDDSLWMGQISDDLDDIMQLVDHVLAMSEKVVKRAKIIKDQLTESQKYIRDCGGEGKKVTDRLEKL
ncbi:hypothetical protein BGZ60DRAFT_568492 [Tricladium varicosporioides]|nr:hypothetical protein BGZ60DRAFT_568492 [Hymenoscyphus varicosporioides]